VFRKTEFMILLKKYVVNNKFATKWYIIHFVFWMSQ